MLTPAQQERRADVSFSMVHWVLALGTTPSFFIAAYLNHTTGASLAILGVIATIARVYDSLINPVVGVLSDRTRTRLGRRKPWVLVGLIGMLAVLLAGVLILGGQSPQHFSPFWYAVGLMALFTMWTGAGAPYDAHAGEVTKSYDRRSRMVALQCAVGIIASFITYGLPYVLVDPDMAWLRRGLADALPDAPMLYGAKAFLEADGLVGVANYGRVMVVLAWLTILTAPILIWRYMRYVPELPIPPKSSGTPRATPSTSRFQGEVFLPLRNPLFLTFCGGFLIFVAGYIGRLSLYPFIVPYATGGGYSFLLLMLLQCAAGLLATPLWSKLFHYLERGQIMMLACVIEAVGLFCLGLSTHGMPFLTLFGAALIGMPGGTVSMIPNLMASDAADYSRFKHGGDTRGLHTSILGLIHKVGSFLATIGLAVAGMMGFNPKLGVSPQDVINIKMLGLYGPAILILIGGAIMLTFPITRTRHRVIQARIERRERGELLADGVA